MGRIDFARLSQILFCVLFGIIAVYLFFRYLFFWLLPFIIAWCVAMLTRPASKRLSRATRLPGKLCSVTVMLLALALFGFLVFSAVYRLVYELQRLLVWIGEDSASLSLRIGEMMDYFSGIGADIPLINNLENMDGFRNIKNTLDGMLTNMLSGVLESVSSRLPILAADIISRLPSFFLGVTVTVIACFYFALDIDGLHVRLASLLPERMASALPMLKKNVATVLLKYLKSYLILLTMTFLELFVGFSILRVDYAFLLALLIAFVDVLPVFGVGTVLVPWAIVMLLMKNYYLGIGLLILYGVSTLIRQFAEPKILGHSLGLHPLFTLVAMYVGFEVFGFFGMFFAPTLLILLKPIFDRKARFDS